MARETVGVPKEHGKTQ